MTRSLCILLAMSLSACAGISGTITENEMFNSEKEKTPDIKINIGLQPPEFTAEMVAKLSPEQIVAILTEQYKAFAAAGMPQSVWLDMVFWQQTNGTTQASEGDIQARIRAQVAKQLQETLTESEK